MTSGPCGNSQVIRRTVVVAVFAIVLAYVFTSMTVWTTDGRFLVVSRYNRVLRHREGIAGTGFAPDQYRFGSYFMVDYIFKHIPLFWYDIFSDIVDEALISGEEWSVETKESMDLFFPVEEREKLIAQIETVIDEAVKGFSPNNILLQNMLKSAISSAGWHEYIDDIEKAAILAGESIPNEFKNVMRKGSEENRIVNGYITFRFFFTFLFMILTFLYCRYFMGSFESLLGMVLLAGILPLVAQDFMQAETMFSLAIFAGSLLSILKGKSYLLILLLVLLGCTARTDHMLFVALIYALYRSREAFEKRDLHEFLRAVLLISIPLAAAVLLSAVVYPDSRYYVDLFQFSYNLTHQWAWIYPLIFLGISLVFTYKIREIDFFRKTWIWIIPFLLMNYAVARPAEVRLLLPVLFYSIPFVIAGTKDILSNSRKSEHPSFEDMDEEHVDRVR